MARRERASDGETAGDTEQVPDADPDADFRDEVLPDNTRPPVGRSADDEG
jgi:hypothetical protein